MGNKLEETNLNSVGHFRKFGYFFKFTETIAKF